MPGPCSLNRTPGIPAPNSPNRKVARRLAGRIAEYVERNSQNGQTMHKPGSQNRKK